MGRPPRAVLVAALLVMAPAALSPAALALSAPAEGPAILLVGFDRGLAPPVQALKDLGATVVRVDERLDFAVVVAPAPTAFAALASAVPGVAYVERDEQLRLMGEAVEELQAQQWGLAAVRAPEAWPLLPPPEDRVTIAVLDTGSDWHHPDLAPQLWNGNGVHGDDLTLYASAATCAVAGLRIADCFYLQRPPEEVLGPMDFHGHGTHVAGIAAAARDGSGIAGVAPDAEVRTYKVLPTGQSFFALVDVVASGIALAAADGADVISLSLGCWCESQSLERAVQFAWEKGAVLVAAAGNSDSDTPVYPASYPQVLSVAALDEGLGRWYLGNGIGSSHGPHVDLAAPGSNVLSDRARWATNFGFYWAGLGYKTMSGTSMATPHVAGVAALVLQAWPEATNEEVRSLLEGTSRDLGASGRDDYFGHGLVDAEAAVRAALAAGGTA